MATCGFPCCKPGKYCGKPLGKAKVGGTNPRCGAHPFGAPYPTWYLKMHGGTEPPTAAADLVDVMVPLENAAPTPATGVAGHKILDSRGGAELFARLVAEMADKIGNENGAALAEGFRSWSPGSAGLMEVESAQKRAVQTMLLERIGLEHASAIAKAAFARHDSPDLDCYNLYSGGAANLGLYLVPERNSRVQVRLGPTPGALAHGTREADALLANAAVAELVRVWKRAPNGGNPHGHAVQEAARELFGLENAAEWHSYDSASAVSAGRKLANTHREAYEAFLTSQWAATQELFAGEGIAEIEVYRGTSGQEIQEDGSACLRPLASFSLSPSVAKRFSGGKILAMRVPVEWVLATPFTGVGCLHEGEIVVLGGRFDGVAHAAEEPAMPRKTATRRGEPERVTTTAANHQ